ncbi:MAG: DUF3540 domain-containing protein [Polyangiaceae bacterium]
MKNAASKIEPTVAYQVAGRITRAQGAVFAVSSGNTEYQARRAASCLLAPEEGDEVLLAVVPDRGVFVLAVLERAGDGARLQVDGDLEIQAASGRVVIAAKDGVDLVSTGRIGITSDTMHLTSRAAEIVLDNLSVLGAALQARVTQVKVVAESIDQAAGRLTQRLQRAYRFVAEMEQVRAGRVDIAAEKTVNVHAENTVVTAAELVKVDGGQIHLG